MDQFLKLLYMDGYGMYVWPSYGLVAVILGLQLFMPWKRWKKIKRKPNVSFK